MKSRLSNILLILAFVAGLSLLLYPSVSNYWNSFHATQAIASYAEEVSNMDEDDKYHLIEEAISYNIDLAKHGGRNNLTNEQRVEYKKILDITGTGIMGYIEIPSIKVELPIYHGTDEGVLQIAVGHLDWTSLPVGGESTHCVLSGHRGLPSAQLFTHLDRLSTGDVFMIRVLDEVLTYEVDQVLIVLPEETEALNIVEGEDYCTLVTCTPYGINSHRLLVRGHRIENLFDASSVRVSADAVQIEKLLVAACIALPVLLILFVIVLVRQPVKTAKKQELGTEAAKKPAKGKKKKAKPEKQSAPKPQTEAPKKEKAPKKQETQVRAPETAPAHVQNKAPAHKAPKNKKSGRKDKTQPKHAAK